MKWIITSHVHYDRVASPWLIKRFVDKDARFSFAPASEAKNLPKDAIPVAFPGAKLGPHDENGPVFLKILREYKIQDPALEVMAKVVASGVEYVVHGYRPPVEDRYGQMAVGLLAFSDGMTLFKESDQERLDASYIVWDAIYALFKANKQRG
jgi:hypothetical protein